MKTASTITSLSRRSGGLFDGVRYLHQAQLRQPGVEITVLGVIDSFTAEDLPKWAPLPALAFPVVGPLQLAYSPALRRKLLDIDVDLVHAHGIWEYPSAAVSAWHRKYRRPYLISPHGMLDPWAVNNSGWKKRWAWRLYEKNHLENAFCIRALCQAEADAIRTFGLRKPICIIPNGIELPSMPERKAGAASSFEPFARGRKVLLYLGRIHPKKGLAPLLRAWKAALDSSAASGWILALAGWDQSGHETELRAIVTDNGLQDAVTFLGPRFGEDKAAHYRDCDAFVLPSLSEGLPMVVLEAWAYGKPVLMTSECNLPEGFAAQAALRIQPRSESIVTGLQQLFALNDADRQAMGARGSELVKSRFTWPKIAADMTAVYEWMLGGRKPENVS